MYQCILSWKVPSRACCTRPHCLPGNVEEGSWGAHFKHATGIQHAVCCNVQKTEQICCRYDDVTWYNDLNGYDLVNPA